jgi:Protein kinase domain
VNTVDGTTAATLALLGGSPAIRALVVRWLGETWPNARIELLDTRIDALGSGFEWQHYRLFVFGELDEPLATQDAVARLEASGERPPTLIMGDNFAERDAQRLLRAQCDHVIALPFTRDQLVAAVKLLWRDVPPEHTAVPVNSMTASRLAGLMDQARLSRTGVFMMPKAIPGYLISGTISDEANAPVYAALREGDSAMVAIKLVERMMLSNPESRALVEWRIRTLRSLRSPHVVSLIDSELDGKIAYMAFEYLRGDRLDERLLREAASESSISQWIRQILLGLIDLHREQMVHLDLKPCNILFRDPDNLVIVDFGLSVRAGMVPLAPAPGIAGGTPAYMSPEHAQGLRVDERSDLYSLGIMAFELLTGDVPFKGDTPANVLYRQLHDEVPLVPKSLRHWQRFVDALLFKSPIGRLPRAEDALAMLAAEGLA